MRCKTLSASLVVAALPFVLVLAGSPPPAETPLGAHDLLVARPFELSEAFRYDWSAERPMVDRGWLLVLEVDPVVAWPREVAEPVLYVGDRTAQYAKIGYPSGRIVAIVPGEVDLYVSPIWFGTPELPERVDASVVAKERALADRAGLVPFPEETVRRAIEAGGTPLRGADLIDLQKAARALHAAWVPAD